MTYYTTSYDGAPGEPVTAESLGATSITGSGAGSAVFLDLPGGESVGSVVGQIVVKKTVAPPAVAHLVARRGIDLVTLPSTPTRVLTLADAANATVCGVSVNGLGRVVLIAGTGAADVTGVQHAAGDHLRLVWDVDQGTGVQSVRVDAGTRHPTYPAGQTIETLTSPGSVAAAQITEFRHGSHVDAGGFAQYIDDPFLADYSVELVARTYRDDALEGTVGAAATAAQLGLTSIVGTGTVVYAAEGPDPYTSCVRYSGDVYGELTHGAFTPARSSIWFRVPAAEHPTGTTDPDGPRLFSFGSGFSGTDDVFVRVTKDTHATPGRLKMFGSSEEPTGSHDYCDGQWYRAILEFNRNTDLSVFTARVYDRLANHVETLSVPVGTTFVDRWQEGSRGAGTVWSVDLSHAFITDGPIYVPRDEPTAADPIINPARAQPNIVAIILDDTSYNLLRHMSQARDMAANGVTFARHYAATPLCGPDRAAFMSGKHPHNNGVTTNGANAQWMANPANEATSVMKRLNDIGYHTAFLGKYLNGYNPDGNAENPALYVPPGCDWWFGTGGAFTQTFDYTATSSRDGVKSLYSTEGGQPLEDDYLTDVLAVRAEEFIGAHEAARPGQPFFLWLAPSATHGNVGQADPEDPGGPQFPPAPRDRKDTANRPAEWGAAPFPSTGDLGTETPIPWPDPETLDWNAHPLNKPAWFPPGVLSAGVMNGFEEKHRDRIRMLQSVNDMIAGIRAQLAALGLADDTYIVLTSDNGFHLGERGIVSGKGTPYDVDVRLPLVVYPPGGRPGPLVVDAIVQPVDLLPTCLAIAGAVEDETLDGRSMLPWISGATPAVWRRSALLSYSGNSWQASLGTGTPPDYRGLRSAQGLYANYQPAVRAVPPVDRGEAYNTRVDPGQMDNIWPNMTPARQSAAQKLLRQLMDTSGVDHWLAAQQQMVAVGPASTPGTSVVEPPRRSLVLSDVPLDDPAGRWRLVTETNVDSIEAPEVQADTPGLVRPAIIHRESRLTHGAGFRKLVVLVTDNDESGQPAGLLEANKDALRGLITTPGPLILGVASDDVVQRERFVELASGVDWQWLGKTEGIYTFVLSDPAGVAQEAVYSVWSNTFGHDETGLLVDTLNGSTAPVTNAKIRISGPLNFIRFTDEASGAWMYWDIPTWSVGNPSVPTGSYVMFDLDRWEVAVLVGSLDAVPGQPPASWDIDDGVREEAGLDSGGPPQLAQFLFPLTTTMQGRGASLDPWDRRCYISIEGSGHAGVTTTVDILARAAYR